MRGTRDCELQTAERVGIIPAYAGNTSQPRQSPSKPRDHPRVCGEHTGHLAAIILIRGSSPRMRGTLPCLGASHVGRGIIPAYAGNTGLNDSLRGITGDHPRVCGEHFSTPRLSFRREGSSPRMRGTRVETLCFSAFFGIIPAYAGNTEAVRARLETVRDHPRVCGEHSKEAE